MNEDDSQFIANTFLKKGLEYTNNYEESDILIINTCAVREHAEHRAISELGRLKKWKDEKPERKIIFAGCVAEKLGQDLKKKFSFLDEVVGARALNEFSILAEKYSENENKEFKELKLFNSPVTDYQTITRGCDFKCSYCIVPYVRGKAQHIPSQEIIESIKQKALKGIKEIILLGQTVNSYIDKSNNVTFENLLLKISEIEGIKRIKFVSPHPLYFTENFFKIYSQNRKISRLIHLPVQSGSDAILKKMRRGYTVSKYIEIISALRQADKDTFISTDFIVGYPGETESDFMKTLELAEKTKFCFAFCFKYSQRTKETPVDTVPESEKERRHKALLDVIKKNSNYVINTRIGKIEEVLIENNNSGRALTGFNCSIIDNNRNFQPGEIVKIKVERVEKNTLYGKVQNE